MKHTLKRSICLLATLSLVAGLFPTAALATHTPDPTTNCSSIVGEYTFVSNENFHAEGPSLERTHTFAYNDEWFTGQASTFNQHLATLSALACETTVSYYPNSDERDHSNNSKNVTAFLEAAEFEDVTVNGYYKLEMMPHSAGVALGHKTISDGTKDYTLLAIIPRSAGYKQEWTGNFIVGTENIHEGFKAGRDEILRFVKNYIADNGITGDVKIWTCGHSRGAALANLTSAFFVAGGADSYLPNVSIDPENVYAYTFATPTTVQENGATRGELLSVAGGPRTDEDERYASDAPAAAAPYTGSDAGEKMDPHAAPFTIIHNTTPDYDIITLLPPLDWGFTHFGSYFELSDTNREAFLEVQSWLDPFVHAEYLGVDGAEPGDETIFGYKIFDIDTLQFIDDPNAPGTITQAQCFAKRITGLTYPAPTYIDYATGGWQATLAALAGIYGMNEKLVGSIELWAPEDDRMTAVKTGVFAYLCYVAERLAEEQGIADQNTAAAAGVVDILEYLAKEQAPNNPATVDDVVYLALKWLFNDSDPVLDEEGETVDVSFTSDTVGMVFDAAAQALADLASSDASIEEARAALYTILKGCVYGDGTKEEPGPSEEAYNVRASLYGFLGYILSDEKYQPIIDALADGGTHPASEAIGVLVTLLGPEGTSTLDEAAAESTRQLLTKAENTILNSGRYFEGEPFYADLQGHFNTLREHASQLHRLLMYLLIYDKGLPCTTENNLRTISTFVAQAIKVRAAHYNENYLSWMISKDAAYPAHLHQLTHTAAKAATCTEDGNIEYWRCSVCGLYFADDAAKTEIDAADTIVEKLGHDWGDWEVVKEPTADEEGLEQRVCKHDPNHVETRVIPKLGSYAITYDPNGGTFEGSTEPTTYTYTAGETIEIAKAPTRDGYTFLHWKGSEYQPGDAYTVTENHTFTAQWKKDSSGSNPSSTPTSKTGKTASTGDSAPIAPLAGVAALALLGAFAARRKSKA